MQVVLEAGESRRELDVRVNNPSATVADLVEALVPRGSGEWMLWIGSHAADPDFELGEAGLHEGAVVRLEPAAWAAHPTGPPVSAGTARELVVVNGLDAGRRFPLAEGVSEIGRAKGCEVELPDATISRLHACLTVEAEGAVTIQDLESHNGTWVGDEPVVAPTPLEEGAVVRLGALELEVRPVDDADRTVTIDPLHNASAAGTIPFNRPPRPAPPPPPPHEIAPPRPAKTGQKVPLGLIGILAPIIFAVLMFAWMKEVQFLLFMALTPIMGIAGAIDSKRRGRKTERGEKERFRREVKEFRERLVRLVDEERARRTAAAPDPAEILRRVTLPSTRLWERRPGHPDFLQLRAGIGDVPWTPPVTDVGRGADWPDELRDAVAAAAVLPAAPVPVDLAGGGAVGIVGDREAGLALARWLVCQAAVLHGPADLPVMVLASPEHRADWDWAKWLPHTRDASGAGRMLSGDAELSTLMVESRLQSVDPGERQRARAAAAAKAASTAGPTLLLVVDDESLTEGRKAPTRNLLRGEAGPVASIVVASRAERLPALCTTVIDLTDPDGRADLTRPQQAERIPGFLAAGLADETARECARLMARFEDPELDIVGAGLPASIRLLPLLDMEECTAEAVLARWKAGGVDPRPAGPVGVTERGVFVIDFVADGPHGLVGGTTGSGKSELLRTMVAGLAASVDPDHLTFVLIDFKGGAAFDECSKLPHTVGLVTDLDEHLAERALRCLEAELRHRERVLRAAGAIDLPDYLRNHPGAEPMPRLLVIIDEFATLKAELPDFIDALVGVAQRGRSLGVHMLLATQRPQGAISDNIKANTNLRIALRVQDKGDSTDVIDVPDAANIPRTAPGRAYVRLGPNEVVAIQSALSTGSLHGASSAPVDVAQFVYGPAPRLTPDAGLAPATDDGGKGDTDLSLLVGAINEAFVATGRPRPRRPWPDPLPGEVDLDTLIDAAVAGHPPDQALPFVPLALADDPDAQAQYPMGWRPTDGNLIVYGLGGSGTTTALSSLALSLARLHSPDDVHLYAIDLGAGELAALESLPHVGGIIQAVERERQTRLIRHLRTELDRRRELGSAAMREQPLVVVLIDGWSALAAEYDDYTSGSVIEAFTRVFADGPEVGMLTVIAADRASAVPMRLASLVQQRLALRLADKSDYGTLGIRPSTVPDMVPGRAVVAGSGQVVQIARPADGVAAAAARLAARTPAPRRAPQPIETLPSAVALPQLGPPANLGTRPWTVPIGIAERTLDPAGLLVYQGEHVLITGPARSGKSSALLTVAAVCRRARPDLSVLAVSGPRSPLAGDPLVGETLAPATIGDALAPRLDQAPGAVLLLVDDAEALDDQGGVLERLSTSDRPDFLLVAAGRNDGIRSGYSHWSRALRRSKLGVLLRPDIDLDGDILGTKLPRRAPVGMVAGRGYLVNSGAAELIQLALPR